MKKIFSNTLKFFLIIFSMIIIFFTLKLLLPVNRIELEYPNKGRWESHNRTDFISAEECGLCHQEIYNQWESSGMANATKSALLEFKFHKLSLSMRGFPEEDIEWCYQCHAPLALTTPKDLLLLDPSSRAGVTCMVCHTTVHAIPDSNAGNLYLDPKLKMNGPFDDITSHFHESNQHQLFLDDNSDLCASCHYSVYPRNNIPIDWTWKEWDETEGEMTCKQCHMPEYEGKSASRDWVPERKLRKHTFPGGGKYNLEFIKTSASLDVKLDSKKNKLLISITNNCGHNFPTGNGSAPAIELRVINELDKSIIYKEFYKNSYIGHLGFEVLDPTIAIKKGDDTSIPAYQTVNREIELDNFQKIKEIKVDLIFHYWLPFEKEYQIQSGIKTLINYSLLPEVNIATIVKTLFKKNIWEVLGELKDIKPKPIYLIDSKLILVNRTL
jgi:hypothetical protein